MARPLHVRLPEKLMSKIEKIEQLEDKSKTHIVITLLEEALSMRDFKSGDVDTEKQAFDELQNVCTTTHILSTLKILCDLYRMNYDNAKSKYSGEAETANEAIDHMMKHVESFVDGRLNRTNAS